MKNVLFALLITAASLLVAPDRAEGHHGHAGFDKSVTVTLTGTVLDFHWTNPHCVIEFEVKDAKGQVRKWHGELSSPVHLVPKGWTATTLEAGDKITVSGFVAKNNVPAMWISKVVLPDGKELKAEFEN